MGPSADEEGDGAKEDLLPRCLSRSRQPHSIGDTTRGRLSSAFLLLALGGRETPGLMKANGRR